MRKSLSLMLVLMLIACCTSAMAWGESNADLYENAIDLLKENKYTEAGQAFAALGSYNDSPRYTMYCNAIVAGEAGFYSTAVENLQSLDGFLDSKLLATYYAGLSWEVTEDYEKAADVMSGITLYKDVSTRIASYPEKINERDYRKADANEKAGNLESALSGFKALGNYQDSAARAEAVQEKIYARDYAAADQAEQAGKLEEALAGFKALGSYQDSVDRAAAVQTKIDERDAAVAEQAKADAYAAADQAEQAGDFITAYDGFIQLGDYSDCKERAAAIKAPAEYAKGLAAIDRGNYKEAYVFFDGLGDYEDSKERAYALGIANYAELTTISQGIATFEFHESYGFVNFNEGVLIAPQWASVSVIAEDRIAVQKDGKYAVINLSGKHICDYRWTDISSFNAQGICVIASKTGSSRSAETVLGLMNRDGKVLAACEWKEIGNNTSNYARTPSFSDGRIRVYSQDKKYGYLAEDGSLAVRAVYEDAASFSNGLAAVKSGSNWGYIDPNNRTVIDFKYQEAYSFTAEGTADVCRNGEWQIIDKEGKLIYFKSSGEAVQTELRSRVVAKLVGEGIGDEQTCDTFVQNLLDGDTKTERAILTKWLDKVGWKVNEDIYVFIDHCINTGADYSSIWAIAEALGVK